VNPEARRDGNWSGSVSVSIAGVKIESPDVDMRLVVVGWIMARIVRCNGVGRLGLPL
jgi:hypothetical protein